MNPSVRFRLVFAALMSFLMSIAMTGWVTWLNLGLRPGFGDKWAHAFIVAWPAAFMLVTLCAPLVQSLTQRLVGRP